MQQLLPTNPQNLPDDRDQRRMIHFGEQIIRRLGEGVELHRPPNRPPLRGALDQPVNLQRVQMLANPNRRDPDVAAKRLHSLGTVLPNENEYILAHAGDLVSHGDSSGRVGGCGAGRRPTGVSA